MFAPTIAKPQPKASSGSTGHRAQQSSRQTGKEPADSREKILAQKNTAAGQAPHRISWNFHETPLFPREQAGRSIGSFPLPGVMQRKLAVGETHDPMEHEADAVAANVMRLPDPVRCAGVSPPQISRKCAACEAAEKKVHTKRADEDKLRKCAACEAEEKLRTKRDHGSVVGQEAPPAVHETLRSSGRPLDAATRSFFEPRFGADFSGVQVHTDAKAAESAQSVGALGYAVGQHMVFAEGRFSPGTGEGRRLIAHELAHVVQQSGGSSPALRRVGDSKAVPPGLSCPPATSDPPEADEIVLFANLVTTLTPDQKTKIAGFVSRWKATGNGGTVRVDGFASEPGNQPQNWQLSCDRAAAVKAELMAPQGGGPGIPEASIEFFMHGQTGEFGDATQNRRATIAMPSAPAPTPTPPPPAPAAPAKVCGPDVAAEMKRAWSDALAKFAALGTKEKTDNCRMLVQPVIVNPGTGKLSLNQDAFDTWGLFQNSAGWTRTPPWHGPCGTPGVTSPGQDPEDDKLCSNTVQVGSDCWLSGTPNYGLFGVLMRACFDFTTPLALIPGGQVFHELFSLPSTATLVAAYKLLKHDSIVGPEKWATSTWLGGPGATASGGNRPTCTTTCPGPPPPPFLVVWEPNMPRSAMPVGPPYFPPP